MDRVYKTRHYRKEPTWNVERRNAEMDKMSQPDIQIPNPLTECVAITGQRQSGKTKLLEELMKYDPNPSVTFDTLGIISGDVAKGNLSLRPNQKIINPHWSEQTLPSYEERLAVFLPICEMVWKRGNLVFNVEEWHLFCKTKFALPDQFGNLFNQGGNRHIAVRGTSQRAAQVHNDALAACTHHFIFKLSTPQDRRWMCDVVEKELIEGDPKDPKKMCVRKMPKYYFLYYNNQTDQAEFFKPLSI